MGRREDAVSEPEWSFKPGDRFHQLEIVRPLGAGGQGEVYLAEHVHKNELFALKVMRLEDRNDAGKVRRALSTSKASYRIQHANVVRVEDLGCEPDARVWVLMEYLLGSSIGVLLARQGGRLSLPLALHVAIEAAWGLDAAHEMGIIHRDVKPDNVWLAPGGGVKVLDWSLAKVIPEGIQTTRRKSGFGTAPYMAPEALRGADPDARVDVYALGIMLWEMIAGHPFPDAMRDTQEMIRRHLYVEPTPLSRAAGLPPYVDDFMRRAVAKDPAARFFTVAEMAREGMALRDRLLEDAGRGVFAIEIPPGEPAVVTNPSGRRAYEPPRPPPEREAEPAAPSRRMVLPTGAVPLARTQLLPEALGGTVRMTPQPTRSPETPPPAPAVQRGRLLPSPLRGGAGGGVSRRPVLLVMVLSTAIAGTVGAVAWTRLRPAPPPALLLSLPPPPTVTLDTPKPPPSAAPLPGPEPSGAPSPRRPSKPPAPRETPPAPQETAPPPPAPTAPHRLFDSAE
jgi:hypothetical protein